MIVVVGNPKKTTDWLHEWLSSDIVVEDFKNSTQGLTFRYPDANPVIWLPEVPKTEKQIAVLAHEVFHAVLFILDKIGIELNGNTEEIYAYLVSYFMHSILEAVRTKKCRSN